MAGSAWWKEKNMPFTGEFFDRMVLREEDPEEQRVQKIRQSMLPRYQEGKRRLSFHWASSVTRSYMETEGLHPAIRRALSIKRGLEEIPLGLTAGQMLMGGASAGPHYVDFNPHFPALDFPEKGSCAEMDRIYVYDSEELREFQEQILPYWKNKGRMDYLLKEMELNYPEAYQFMNDGQCYIYQRWEDRWHIRFRITVQFLKRDFLG